MIQAPHKSTQAMARKSKVILGVLNVVAHPHSPEIYRSAFLAAFRAHREARRTFKLHGDIRALIHSCFETPEGGGVLEGEIVRFLDLSSDDQWFNLEKADAATDEDLSKLNIPSSLRPKMQRIRFVFMPEGHRFVFTVSWKDWALGRRTNSGMTPKAMKSLLCQFFGLLALPDPPTVTVEQDHETVEKMFALRQLNELVVHVTKPNADDESDFERAVLAEMEQEHVREKEVALRSDGRSIAPNPRTKALAVVAKSNGYATAKGLDEHYNRVSLDTRDHPLLLTYSIDHNAVVFADWLRATSAEVVGELKARDKHLLEAKGAVLPPILKPPSNPGPAGLIE